MDERRITLQFGRLFHVIGDPEKIEVVTGFGKNNTVYSAKVVYQERNIPVINFVGSGTVELNMIGRLLGVMSLEEIIAAYKRGHQRSGVPFSSLSEATLRSASRQKPRTISW